MTRLSLPLVSASNLRDLYVTNRGSDVEFDDLQPLSFDAPLKTWAEQESGIDPVRYSADQMDEDTYEPIAELSETPPHIALSPTLAAADTNMDLPPSSPAPSHDDLFSGTMTPNFSATENGGDSIRCGVCGSTDGQVNHTSY